MSCIDRLGFMEFKQSLKFCSNIKPNSQPILKVVKKVYYNKLVRDNIPQVIKKSGGDFKIKKLSKKEFEKELIRKVGEEASGLVSARDKQGLVSELADVLDVIEEIKRFKGITGQEIKKSQKSAYSRKGGFDKRLYLFWASDTGYKTNEKTTKAKR